CQEAVRELSKCSCGSTAAEMTESLERLQLLGAFSRTRAFPSADVGAWECLPLSRLACALRAVLICPPVAEASQPCRKSVPLCGLCTQERKRPRTSHQLASG